MQSSKLPINLVPLLPCTFLRKSLLILPLAMTMMMILFFEIDPQLRYNFQRNFQVFF
ncbi:Low affinity immunoglobulin gamma Fc region receptor III [Bienertia sinuspersici]